MQNKIIVCGLVSLALIAILAGGADSGLVLYFKFDEDNEKVRDQSGRGNDGYWVGAPCMKQASKARRPDSAARTPISLHLRPS